MSKKLVWTRPLFYKEQDYRLLKQEKIPFIHLPCTLYKNLDNFNLPDHFSSKDILIFTNFYSALLFSKLSLDQIKKEELKIITMSEKASELLISKGFFVKLFASQTAKEFGEKLCQVIQIKTKTYLIGPCERAYDLRSHLEKNGIQSSNIDAYTTIQKVLTEEGKKFSLMEKTNFLERDDLIFSFFSPSAAKAFLEDFEEYKTILKNKHISITIGETTDSFCKDFFAKTFQAKSTSALEVLNAYKILKYKKT